MKELLAPVPISDYMKATIKYLKQQWGTRLVPVIYRGLKERRHDYLSWLRITHVIATSVNLGFALVAL
ncbi:unnamed protein product [Triticum turgidum subsp. durum]|uniref:Uncharacterized protein n=1 Tax=Triticum turgidum subsp. durum TaxID=4567 RepID=A0A9R0RIH8_TRITD|nr:unnamed protein product [Triticum turgidum subsp. durum]